jgi:uroporphyrinogen III methyltransferase/synthase
MSGKVYLVGAGPGDPGLITRKGAACLRRAQVVVYDYLANPALLELAPPGAERIYVGKRAGRHAMPQEEINRLLCRLAGEGKTVVRLKGGDPFVFGRGGEEASALAAAGVAWEVVPGVTSAVAAPAYAGIPVTDRRAATEVAFVTGHEDPTKGGSTIDWAALAGMGTVVFLMGVGRLAQICARLVEHGKPPETPAATIRWGATPRQQTVVGTLADLPRRVEEAGIRPPAVTVVGPVVALRQELAWFERLPLFGRRVVVTRTRRQASRLSAALRELGAEVLEIPTIAIVPPADPRPLAEACTRLDRYHWLVFTSPNGVESFFAALDEAGRDSRSLAGIKVAAIGPATAQGLAARGVRAEVVARRFVAEGLLEALGGHELRGRRVLIPRAEKAREILPETLARRGAVVEVVPAYRTVVPEDSRRRLQEALEAGVDAITLTSSSTVRHLVELLGPEQSRELARRCQAGEITLASIGPVTTAAARELGLEVAVEADPHTIDALVAALAARMAAS